MEVTFPCLKRQGQITDVLTLSAGLMNLMTLAMTKGSTNPRCRRLRVLLAIIVAIALIGGLSSFLFADTVFSGFSEFKLGISPSEGIAVESLLLTMFLEIDAVTFSTRAVFEGLSFSTFQARGMGDLGEISFNSVISWTPSELEFDFWQTSLSVDLFGLELRDVLYLTTPQTSSYNQLSWAGSGDIISTRGTWEFDLSPLAFSAVNACATFDWLECDTSVTGCVTFEAEEGFSVATISLKDYVLFEDVMGVSGSLSVTVLYTIEEKLVTPRLNLTPDWFVCSEIDILAEFDISSSGAPTVDSALIYGVKGGFTSGSVTARFAESFSESKNSTVTGKADYFERLGLSVDIPGCCGPPGSLDFDAYFERVPSGSLFSWGLMTMSAQIHLIEGVSFVLDLQFAKDEPKWAISFSTKIFW